LFEAVEGSHPRLLVELNYDEAGVAKKANPKDRYRVRPLKKFS